MPDRLSPSHRSWLMSRVKGTNTTPEIAVGKIVRSLGFRFRTHCSKLPGKPDIVLAKLKKIVLVHGCFWHAHKNCPKARIPKTRPGFWSKKFAYNKAKDRRNLKDLRAMGWSVAVVWQCELKDGSRLTRKLARFLIPKKCDTSRDPRR